MPITAQDAQSLIGQTMFDPNGDEVGKVEDIYLDEDTSQPEWAVVHTGRFGSKQSFVPLTGSEVADRGVRVPYDKEQVAGAPRAEPDGDLSRDEEAELYHHYGVEYSEHRSDSGLPTGDRRPPQGRDADQAGDTSRPTTDSAMARSEGERSGGTARRPSDLVRLRKEIVTENVTVSVPVEREVVRVEREPMPDEIGVDEHPEVDQREIEDSERQDRISTERDQPSGEGR